MRRTIILLIALVVAFSIRLYPARNYKSFNKGIAYILLQDYDLSVKYMEDYFNQLQDPALRSCYINLIDDNSWEVTKQFKRYLDINHRSTTALVGIALSTTDMEDSTSVGNLKRTIRLDSRFAAAYLCLGMEYLKSKNYPAASRNFSLAIRLGRTPEFKILQAHLSFILGNPGHVLSLLKIEADRNPDNFYFNYYTAEAYYRLDQLDAMGKYIETAIEVKPKDEEAQLLLAKFLLNKNELKRAKTILQKLKFKGYHEDYTKTYGHVLLKLKNKQAKSHLDQVYFRNKWDKDINRLMGIYWLGKGDKENVQNWVNRSILAGNPVSELAKEFPGQFQFPQYKRLPFFQIKSVDWINEQLLLVVGTRKSGEKEKIYFVQSTEKDFKVIRAVDYRGTLQKLFFSPDRKRLVFAATYMEKESVFFHGLEITDRTVRFSSLYPRPINIKSIVAGFNKAGTMVYITDGNVETRAFDSPFSIVSELGRKTPLYPAYPYPMYKYNFLTKKIALIKDIDQFENIPIPCIKKYYEVYDAYQNDSAVQRLIQKGQRLDLTSSSVVRIFFSKDLSSFIIYLSDLKNAFQARLIDNFNNKVRNINETMFLGEGQYAELTLLDYDPEVKELVVVTKDAKRNLIKFNHDSKLYTRMTEKVMETRYDKESNIFYVLTQRSKKRLYTETNLEIIHQEPYLREVIDDRRTLNHIVSVDGQNVIFSTIDGKWLQFDLHHRFTYVGPSFEGSTHALSPSKKQTAAFINGNLFLVEKIVVNEMDRWAKKKSSKK